MNIIVMGFIIKNDHTTLTRRSQKVMYQMLLEKRNVVLVFAVIDSNIDIVELV